jgi:pimeloyl-ACP methyl ester carboxylesterase
MIWVFGVILGGFGGLGARLLWRALHIRRRYPPIGHIIPLGRHRVHALSLGEGPDLVMIHGSSGQLRDLMPLIRRLSRHFRVTAFDRPGMGHSTPIGAEGISPAGQARHLAEAAAQLGIRAPLVLGQSYGGTVALAWALDVKGPQAASGLVLLAAPSLPWQGNLDWWYRLTATRLGRLLAVPLAAALVTEAHVERMIPGLFAPSLPPDHYTEEIGALLALDRGALGVNADQINALLAHITRMEAAYTRLDLPIEMIHGAQDPIVPLALHSEPLAARLPSARLEILPDAGHMPHHTHPEAVEAACLRAKARCQGEPLPRRSVDIPALARSG